MRGGVGEAGERGEAYWSGKEGSGGGLGGREEEEEEGAGRISPTPRQTRSEEHTSELQSR